MAAGGTRTLALAVLTSMVLLFAGSTTVEAAANTRVDGQGTTNALHCPQGGAPLTATIDISAQKSKGIISGSGQIFGTGVNKFFSLTSGSINNNAYSLSGATSFDQCGTFSSQLPARVTVSGQCGVGVTIHYRDSAGQVGEFVGNVVCG